MYFNILISRASLRLYPTDQTCGKIATRDIELTPGEPGHKYFAVLIERLYVDALSYLTEHDTDDFLEKFTPSLLFIPLLFY